MFDIMFKLQFCQEPAENGHKEHKKFPEIFFPSFGVVGVVVDFHMCCVDWRN
jgi:hypothetical protein